MSSHHSVPFPSQQGAAGVKPQGTDSLHQQQGPSSARSKLNGMSIEIPRAHNSNSGSSHQNQQSQDDPRRDHLQQQHTSSAQQPHSTGSNNAPRTFHHHPRQPGPSADSYFSGTLTSHHTQAGSNPRTPGGNSFKGHSRTPSTASTVGGAKSQPMTQALSSQQHQQHLHQHQQHAQNQVGSADFIPAPHPQHSWAGLQGGLPSPSTLTDILLGLHSTLYGGKRSPEEVREMVWQYYDADAVFESPLLSAKGREQVANQFIMAFALPGLDVTSELRDVICSDFEFDGTRAGIIDQTISVTVLPSIFGSSASSQGAPMGRTPHPADHDGHNGHNTPGYHHPQSTVTPHPFADYRTPGASAFGHVSHSPTTPFSLSSLWGGSSSRPHTPGGGFSSGVRPFTSSAHPRNDTPPSVNGGDDELNSVGGPTVFASADAAGGGAVSRLRMPLNAITPHWSSEGLGRSTFGSLLWGLFHPRAVLKHMCTINLRLMSRLEFNDAGHIVRHEDTWGVRETIEGSIPFASLIYALERRLVGYLTSWAVEKGFSLSAALHPHQAIQAPPSNTELALLEQHQQHRQQQGAHEAAHALLGGRGRGFQQHEQFQTISRSRAPSPTRFGWSPAATTPVVTGTRTRARSSAGSFYGGSRAASSDNLASMGQSNFFASGYERGADKDLPPDSSARYRTLGRRLDGGRSNSITSAPSGNELSASVGDDFGRSKAPDRDPNL